MNLEDLIRENELLKKRIASLEKTTEKQAQIIFDLNRKLNEQIKKYEIVHEKKRIVEATKFIPKTEKLEVIINEPEEILKEEKTEKKEKSKRGMKKGGKKFANFDFEKYVTEIIREEPEETSCPNCGSELVVASEKVRYVIETIPATLKVTKIIKVSKKCPDCNSKDNKLYYPISNEVFPGSIVTPSFMSYLLYNKYELGVPFNHLERHIKSTLNIDISKQTMADYAKKSALLLTPLYEKMVEDLKKEKVIHADETTLVVSKDLHKEENRKKSYVFAYCPSFYSGKQMMLYSFHETRKVDEAAAWLKTYNGTLICDDYAGYDKIRKQNSSIKIQRCMAHARRRFADILKTVPEEQRKGTTAYKILCLFQQIFKLEKKYNEEKYFPSEIKKHRLIDQIPIKNELDKYINKEKYKANSALESAVNYVKGIWDDMWTYLDDGFVEPSNNAAERAIKPFVIQRKVFQTAGSYAGAKYTTILFSIIQSARINGLNVEKYITYLLQNINKKKLEELTPYSEDINNGFRIIKGWVPQKPAVYGIFRLSNSDSAK